MKRQGGFTLIEVLVVVIVIALISVLALPSISSYFSVTIESSTRSIASIAREAFNSAVVTGRVHRIVFDIDKRTYWVESGPYGVTLDTEATREKERLKTRFTSKTEKKEESDFSIEKSVMRKPSTLPLGVSFDDIISQQSKNPITAGRAYAHIFPHGICEQVIVHLKDTSQHKVTLVLNAIGGETSVYRRYVDREEAYASP